MVFDQSECIQRWLLFLTNHKLLDYVNTKRVDLTQSRIFTKLSCHVRFEQNKHGWRKNGVRRHSDQTKIIICFIGNPFQVSTIQFETYLRYFFPSFNLIRKYLSIDNPFVCLNSITRKTKLTSLTL